MVRISICKVIAGLLLLVPLGACALSNPPRPISPAQSAEAEPTPDRLVEIGNGLLEQGQYQEATKIFGKALGMQSDHVGAKLGVAESFLGVGALQRAYAAFTELTAIAAVNVPARQGQGIALLLLGKTDKARTLLQAVVSDDPGAWRAWNALGRCYDLAASWQESAHAYDMALKAKPKAPVVQNNIGMSLLSQGRYAEAEARFLEALAGRSDFETARNNLRFAIAMQGRYRDAFAGVARADLPVVLNNVGYAALLRGEKKRAEAYFQRAIETSPHFFELAYNNLQQAKGSGDDAKALGTP